MTRDLDHLRRALACLSHASRFRILLQLLERPCFVSELARAVKLSQSCTTRHLQAMSRVGLVCGNRSGRRVFFEVQAGAPVLAAFTGCLPPLAQTGAGLTTDRAASAGPGAAGGSRTRIATARARDRGRDTRHSAPRLREARGALLTGTGSDRPAPEPEAIPRNGHDLEDFLL